MFRGGIIGDDEEWFRDGNLLASDLLIFFFRDDDDGDGVGDGVGGGGSGFGWCWCW